MQFSARCVAKSVRARTLALLAALLSTWLVSLPASPAGAEQQLRVFAPQTVFTVPTIQHNGTLYAGLFEILEPLGRVESHVDKQKWELKFTAGTAHPIEVQFTQGMSQGKLNGIGYDLPAEFVLFDGRGYVPVTSLGGMLPRILTEPVQLQPGNRLLIGSLGFSFNQQIRQNPPALVLNFPSPVNPMIATEPGRIRLTFTREPLILPADGGTQRFSDPVFQSSGATASNGALQLTINVATPVAAVFSDGGKTITISPAASSPSAQATQSETEGTAQPSNPAASAQVPPKPVVVIDAAHGGSDLGAMLSGNVPEKDLTLTLARLIQHDLEARGMATRMVRSSDGDLSCEQRAAAVNSAHPLAYIAIHASGEGQGVRLYTALLPAAVQQTTRRQFVAWDKAQAGWLDLSGSLAGSMAAELNQRKVAVQAMAFPLRPLNNIWAPAVALEVTPPAKEDVKSGEYLHTISASVTAGVAAVLPKLEAR